MNRPIEKEYVLGKIYGLADDIKDTPPIDPCEDAISRESTIKEIKGWFQIIELNPDILIDNIKCLPSVAPSRPSGEWIPCSERLPEASGDYLVTYEWIGFSGTKYIEMRIATFERKQWESKSLSVIAWMPLPEPYKESE